MPRIVRSLILAFLASLVVLTPIRAQTGAPDLASNWCAYAGESSWTANRPAQNALARITVQLRCMDDSVSGLRVKAETRCGRALCTWSWSEEAAADGVSLRAVFMTFTAARTMRLQMEGDQMNVEVVNDYNQPGRDTDMIRATLQRAR